jgi:hypothetical protein
MKNNVKCALATLTSMITLYITDGSAHAFDTGHHADLTGEALAEVGMSNTAIQICQVENWLVDYYSVSPNSSDGIVREVAKLHADNLRVLLVSYTAYLATSERDFPSTRLK